MKFYLLLGLTLVVLGSRLPAQDATTKHSVALPYSANIEETVYPPSASLPDENLTIQDTSQALAAYVGPFQDGYRVLRRDGKMGLLHGDLRLRVPFKYDDIQYVPTGTEPAEDFVLIARRSPYGRYGIIDEAGEPTSAFVLSYSPSLRILENCIVDNPQPGRFFLWYRDGRSASDEAFSVVYAHPGLLSSGHRVLTVGKPGNNRRVALFNLDAGRVVSPYIYRTITAVSPVVAPRVSIPLLEGFTTFGMRLLRPDGSLLSDKYFAGVEDYNNWKQLRTFFGLPDDPKAEAIAWTEEMDVYIVYEDDSVVFIGRYGN